MLFSAILLGSRCTGSTSEIVATATVVTLFLSIALGFTIGVGACYLAQKKCHCIGTPINSKINNADHEHQITELGVNLQENLSYGKVKKTGRGAKETVHPAPNTSKMIFTEPNDQEHRKPAPYEEPIKTRKSTTFTEPKKARSDDLTHSYCEIEEETSKKQETASYNTPASRVSENVKLKANLSYGKVKKARREGVVSGVRGTKEEVHLNINQSYGQNLMERTETDTRPEYDYVDM